jgi:peptidoglycan-associated lipoprotein
MAIGVGSGCRKKPVGVTNIPGRPGPGTSGPGGPIEPGQGISTPDEYVTGQGLASSGEPMNNGPQDREKLKAETIYFDLDSATIKESEKAKLDRVADYLKNNASHDVLIEGHCDERGTEGYNLSLGERRAQAAREYLASVGAPVNNIYTVSFGEARPAIEGQGESAWGKNRRAEFVVALPAQ